jgi:hypothetical protein
VREQLNDNPIAQIALVGILVVAVAFLFVTRSGGGEEEAGPAPTEATVAVAGTEASGSATGATPGEAVEGATEAAREAAATEASATSAVPAAAGTIQTRPLPADLSAAYHAGKTVVLIVVDNRGIDDRMVKRAAARLRSLQNAAVFVVPAAKIARYAAITLGVEVERVPALVAVRPKRLSGSTPQASVSYGFQSSQSVVQAVKDAGYRGPTVDYHP